MTRKTWMAVLPLCLFILCLLGFSLFSLPKQPEDEGIQVAQLRDDREIEIEIQIEKPTEIEKPPSARDMLDLGIQYHKQKQYHEAIAEYQKIINDFAETEYAAVAQFRLAYVYYEGTREMEKALAAYEKVISDFPESKYLAGAQLTIGKLYNWQLNQVEKALEAYQKVVSDFPESGCAAEAQFRLAYAYYQGTRETEKALAAYQKVISDFPESDYAANAQVAIGDTYYRRMKQDDKALEAYQKAVDNYPTDYIVIQAQLTMARIYQKAQRNDPRVIELYENIISAPFEGLNVGEAKYCLGRSYGSKGDHESASSLFKAAIGEFGNVLSDATSSRSELQRAHYMTGLVYRSEKNHEQSIIEFQNVLDNYSDFNPDICDAAKFLIASYYERKGDYIKALQDYREIANNADSSHAPLALLRISKHEAENGEYEQAIETYSTVISISPESRYAAAAHGGIAKCHLDRGQYDKAIEELQKIVKDSPFQDRKASAQFRIGMYYWTAKKYAKGIEALQKGIEAYPDNQYLSHKRCRDLIVRCEEGVLREMEVAE